MARVDFYILASTDESERLAFVCRLTDKAWRRGHRVWIHADNPAHAERLDEWLWTFSQGSFVPHERAGAQAPTDCPVLIGTGDDAVAGDDALLINEAADVPPFAADFPRIAEVVNHAEDVRRAGRARYTHYRDSGHDLHHHRLE